MCVSLSLSLSLSLLFARPCSGLCLVARTYEVEAQIPLQTDLRVSLWDYDMLDKDDLVGSTVIDLEDRWLSQCRAVCGLPQTYTRDSFNAWRDMLTPREILDQLCEKNDLPEPLYSDDPNNVWVRTALPGRHIETYTCQYLDPENDFDVKLENAALAALHSMDFVRSLFILSAHLCVCVCVCVCLSLSLSHTHTQTHTHTHSLSLSLCRLCNQTTSAGCSIWNKCLTNTTRVQKRTCFTVNVNDLGRIGCDRKELVKGGHLLGKLVWLPAG